MGLSGDQVKPVVALIPKRLGPNGQLDLDQSLFKNEVTLRLMHGDSKRAAVELATAARRATRPDFEPEIKPDFWTA